MKTFGYGALTFLFLVAGCSQPGKPAASAVAVASTKINTIAGCAAALGKGDYDVEIVFSGIALFERQDAKGYIDVRMPNASAGRPAIKETSQGSNDGRPSVLSHVAYILSDNDTARPLIDAGIDLQPAFSEASCFSYYRLIGDVVTVDPASAPININNALCLSDAKEADDKYCPSTTTKGSMHWLPSIKAVVGGTPAPHTGRFADTPDPQLLAGIVHVDRGYLETVVTNKAVFVFRMPPGTTEMPPKQALAQEVRWHMKGKGTEFKLHLKRKNKPDQVLTFLPVNGKVSLFIANNPPGEIGPIHMASSHNQDDHFRLYYEFVNGMKPETGPVPFTSTSLNCQGGSLAAADPTLKRCDRCPNDPTCPVVTGTGSPLPSGLNCGGTQWP